MAAINLYVNEYKVSYEMRYDTIVLKEKSSVIFEVPIPKGYHLIGIKEDSSHNKNFIITPYELTKPNYIPEGYGNLNIDSSGFWKVEEKEKDPNLFTKRELFYLDSTLLKPAHYLEVSNNTFKISQEEIPKSFWFSNQHRLFVQDFVGTDTWIKINNIPEFLKKFDPRSRLITEEECLSIIAYNESSDFTFKNYTKITGIEMEFNEPKFALCGGYCCIENWDKVVLSREDRNIYRYVISKNENGLNYKNQFISANISYDKMSASFVIPVIDEESSKKVLVK